MTGVASAPASSGNLGPGFDVLALALEIRCTVVAEEAAEMTVDDGDGPIALRDGDMIHRAVTGAAGRPMALRVRNEIPRTRGLGSSSAVTVASAAAAIRALGGEPDSTSLFALAADIEGHDDNAGAAVYGGLIAASGGAVRSLQLHPALRFVVGVPESRLRTAEARSILKESVPLATATRSVSRAVFLIEGLRTGDRVAFAAARGDELHEQPRSALSPLTGSMIEAALEAGAHHAAWSGAGPTTLAVTSGESLGAVHAAMAGVLGARGEALRVDVATEGWR